MMVAGAQRRSVIAVVAALALAACIYRAVRSPRDMASAYLPAYLFFLAPVMGSLALLMIHSLTGGKWGLELRVTLLAALRVLPILAILLIPLLICATDLYPWARAGETSQSRYLSLPAFLARSVACFGLWLWLGRGLRVRLAGPAPASGGTFTLFPAAALVVYLFTITIVATDWVMSLSPPWHSSVFGLTVGTSQVLSAAALASINLGAGRELRPDRAAIQDVARMLLMLVLVWTYLVFMDFLTAWSADLPDETIWYLPRMVTSWRWLGAWIVLVGFLLPFFTLLSPRSNRSSALLRIVAAVLLCAQMSYCIWIVLPSLRPEGCSLSWKDLLPWIGVGGACWARFDWLLQRTPQSLRATT